MPGVVTPLTASLGLEHDFPRATSEFAADLGVIRAGRAHHRGPPLLRPRVLARGHASRTRCSKLPGLPRARVRRDDRHRSRVRRGRPRVPLDPGDPAPCPSCAARDAACLSRRRPRRGSLPGRVRAEEAEWLAIDWRSWRTRSSPIACARRSSSTGAPTAGRCVFRSSPSRRRTTCARAIGRLARLDPPPSEGLLLAEPRRARDGPGRAGAGAACRASRAHRREVVCRPPIPEELPAAAAGRVLGRWSQRSATWRRPTRSSCSHAGTRTQALPLALLKAAIARGRQPERRSAGGRRSRGAPGARSRGPRGRARCAASSCGAPLRLVAGGATGRADAHQPATPDVRSWRSASAGRSVD